MLLLLRILFIGNSLTYTNDLPRMVQQMAGGEVQVAMVAFPDYALEDHLRDERTLAALDREAWDFIVVQQGPSAMESSRAALLRDAQALARRTKGKSRLAFLMVWPSAARARDFPRVAESYRLAAEATGGVFIPAGLAWQESMRKRPDIVLYAADGFHPAPAGSRLAAIEVVRALTGKEPPP